MSKKLVLILAVIYFFSCFNLVWATVIINEVKLYPTEDRFIELYNQGNTTVDLTGWYIQRKTQTGSSFGSLVSKTHFENKNIKAKGYFLISRSQLTNSDIVLSTLTLTESNAIQIKNNNGVVINAVCWGEVNDCEGLNASNPPEGQSVQIKEDGFLVVGNPTPGKQNFDSVSQSSNIFTSTETSVSDSVPQIITEPKTKTVEIPKIKTKITAKTLGFVGLPLSFQATTFGYGGEELRQGRYFWNFGDADSKETKLSDNQSFAHIYYYPGDYTISLDYFQNYYSNMPDASDRIVVKVIKADILISRIGDEKDFFIELFNNTDQNVDISNWVISGNQKNFTIPYNTILAPKKKIIISPKITHFSIAEKNTLKLITPNGETIFDYSSNFIQNVPKKTTSALVSQKRPLEEVFEETTLISKTMFAPVSESLSAQAVLSSGDGNNLYAIIVFLILVGISAYITYLVRQKKVISRSGDDFEILDE